MGVFDKFADAPHQIRKEGQEITIRFQRTGPTTGRISWNIPASAGGCGTDASRAYDGILITVNGKPSNYLSNSPTNGKYYNGDATGDADLHAGDKLDGALVVGAFYHDTKTTHMDINDILPKTAYFVSGYAVDAQGRYHREGVHAYSLPTGEAEWGLPDKAAKHDIVIDEIGGIQGATPTGLQIDTEYTLKLTLDGKEYSVVVQGENALNYSDLVSELKEQLALLGDVFMSPLAPHATELYYSATTKELKQWNGSEYLTLPVVTHNESPSDETPGAIWVVPSNNRLHRYDGMAWEGLGTEDGVQYIDSPLNPTELACDQVWFDGTNAWVYKLTHWEKRYTYIQERNPLLPPLLTCDHYWFNSVDGMVSVWDVDTKQWLHVDVIYSTVDPNNLEDGSYWYDETAKVVKRKQLSGEWSVVGGVAYLETLPSDVNDYASVSLGNEFVFNLSTQRLYQSISSGWEERVVVAFPFNPADRTRGKLWWNATTDNLFAWNAVEPSQWSEVTAFIQSERNPALSPEVEQGSAWYNPVTKEVKMVFKASCKLVYPIVFNSAPGNLPDGTVWRYSVDGTWFMWDGTVNMFVAVSPIYFEPTSAFQHPYQAVPPVPYWFDTDANELRRHTGTSWENVTFSSQPVSIPVGMFWFNTVEDVLNEWNGTSWVETIGMVSVELVPAINSKGRSILSFFTRGTGCSARIEVSSESGLLLDALTLPVIYSEPTSGVDGLLGGALYNQLGVGDDGSPDERRAIHDDIRTALGHPVVQVELTKEQLDLCINLALKELRKFSSFSYKRGVFFLDLRPNQQTYLMTNKCVGFNKVVGVNSIHRYRGHSVSAVSMDNDAFTYAAIQRLYTMGTFDMLSYHLVSSYMEELETLFARRIMFNWHEFDRELSVFSRVARKERVLVDAYFERTEQDLMLDRQTGLWLQRWALAEAKMMLSQSRGKFQSLPGPNGSTQLNASDLQTQAQDEMQKLREQLEDGSMQDYGNLGMRAHFILG